MHTFVCSEGDLPQLEGTEAPVLRTLPDLAQWNSSSGCSSVSFIIFFNKVVDVRVSLSSASCSGKSVEPEEGIVETSDL